MFKCPCAGCPYLVVYLVPIHYAPRCPKCRVPVVPAE